ncbi:MAG: lipopolysaccharide biosynthesis protein [Prevotella sp.]|nr:lipopolysaccharide biosynthesis protein [Prevotella sp.]
MDTLKEKTAKGLFWGAVNNGSTQIFALLIGIFLTRLLSPSDYGLVGMLTIFTVLAGNLQSCGFTQALVNIRRPTDNDYNSVFWFNVIASVSIYIVLFFCAPLIAAYYRQPSLVVLSRVVFLAFLISSLGIAHNAYMFKNMMNKEQTIIGGIALLLSGVIAIVLAVCDFTYWALAWQQIAYITIVNIGRYYFVKWRPTLHIDFTPVRRMFGFSSKMLVTSIINTINSHILTVIFGRLFPAHIVGHFTVANKWNTMASSFVSGTITQVAQPVMSTLTEERERELRVFRKMMRFTSFLSFPCMFGMAFVAREFILVLPGEQWEQCVPLMQVLCIGGAFMPLYTLYQNLAISNGRSDIYMWCNIAQIILQIGVIILFHEYGIQRMVEACTLFNILWLVVWHLCTASLIKLRVLDVLLDIVPFIIVTIFTMVLSGIIILSVDNIHLKLMAKVIIAIVVYVGTMKLLKVKILDECLQFVKRRK